MDVFCRDVSSIAAGTAYRHSIAPPHAILSEEFRHRGLTNVAGLIEVSFQQQPVIGLRITMATEATKLEHGVAVVGSITACFSTVLSAVALRLLQGRRFRGRSRCCGFCPRTGGWRRRKRASVHATTPSMPVTAAPKDNLPLPYAGLGDGAGSKNSCESLTPQNSGIYSSSGSRAMTDGPSVASSARSLPHGKSNLSSIGGYQPRSMHEMQRLQRQSTCLNRAGFVLAACMLGSAFYACAWMWAATHSIASIQAILITSAILRGLAATLFFLAAGTIVTSWNQALVRKQSDRAIACSWVVLLMWMPCFAAIVISIVVIVIGPQADAEWRPVRILVEQVLVAGRCIPAVVAFAFPLRTSIPAARRLQQSSVASSQKAGQRAVSQRAADCGDLCLKKTS